MSNHQEVVLIGSFESAGDARGAIEDLRAASFSDRKIGVLAHNKDGEAEVRSFRALEGNQSGFGAALGAGAGGGAGALWALGIAVGTLPAIGPVIAGGLLAAFAVSAISGAAAGAFAGALIGLGVGDEQAAYYNDEFLKGHTVLVVHAGGRTQLVQSIMGAHHALHRQAVSSDSLAERIEQRHA